MLNTVAIHSDDIVVRRVSAEDALAHIPKLAEVLIDCVEGGASVSFMHPLTAQKAMAFFHSVIEAVGRGERVLLIAESAEAGVVGTVQLVFAVPENQPHRADVAKMLVHRRVRRRGIAKRLMAALEETALDEGRSVLVLDTVTGSDAAGLYESAGWQVVGDIPRYALMPDGTPCSTTFYCKDLGVRSVQPSPTSLSL